MIKLCIVGLGDIVQYYKRGLTNSKIYDLVGVCDINKDAFGRQFYKDTPFYADYTEMIKELQPDCCLVAIGEKYKYPIIKDILSLGVNVLTEKPLSLNNYEFEDLFKTAKENNVILDIMYHYQYGEEQRVLKEITKDLGKLKLGVILLNENYANNKRREIKKENRNHTEAWIDNGINALSILDDLVDLEKYSLYDKTEVISSLYKDTVSAERIFKDKENNAIRILVEWRTGSNKKYYILEYEKGVIIVNSKDMKIYKDDRCVYSKNLDYPRMHDQYYYYFCNCEIKNNYKKHKRIHKLLYL